MPISEWLEFEILVMKGSDGLYCVRPVGVFFLCDHDYSWTAAVHSVYDTSILHEHDNL